MSSLAILHWQDDRRQFCICVHPNPVCHQLPIPLFFLFSRFLLDHRISLTMNLWSDKSFHSSQMIFLRLFRWKLGWYAGSHFEITSKRFRLTVPHDPWPSVTRVCTWSTRYAQVSLVTQCSVRSKSIDFASWPLVHPCPQRNCSPEQIYQQFTLFYVYEMFITRYL